MKRAAVLVVWACGTPTAPLTNARPGPPEEVALTLERSVCFGTCPAYRVTVHGDGRVDWEGMEYVAVLGKRTATIAATKALALVDAADRMRFTDHDETGRLKAPDVTCQRTATTMTCDFRDTWMCSDTTHAVTTLTRGTLVHRIDNDHCGHNDPALATLEDSIDQVANTAAWIKEVP